MRVVKVVTGIDPGLIEAQVPTTAFQSPLVMLGISRATFYAFVREEAKP